MTLKEALKNITFENREYFKFKFPDVRFDKRKAPKTEEELLRATNRKTMNGFLEWEKSPEYANLVAIYLQSKMIDDIYKMYSSVREKAITGDDKAITTFLKLNKEINSMVKASVSVANEVEEDDGLEL